MSGYRVVDSEFQSGVSGLKEYYKTSVGYQKHLLLKKYDYFERFVSCVCCVSSPSDLILDLGCGTGQSTGSIAARGRTVIGSDISDLFIREASKESLCRFVTSDAARLPFQDHIFDVICAMEFIEHVWPVDTILMEMNRVLKPGGRIVIVSPNLVSPMWPIRDLPGMVARRKFRAPLYANYLEAISFFCRALRLTVKKKLARIPEFISRHPDLEHADDGGDFDAVYHSNALDLSRFLRNHGYRVKLHVLPQKSSYAYLRECIARFMGSMWTSFALVGTKPT